MISKNYLLVKGDKIPCYTKSDGKMNCCRVSNSTDVVIPPNLEMVVPGNVVDHIEKDKCCLVEGCDIFFRKNWFIGSKNSLSPKSELCPFKFSKFF